MHPKRESPTPKFLTHLWQNLQRIHPPQLPTKSSQISCSTRLQSNNGKNITRYLIKVQLMIIRNPNTALVPIMQLWLQWGERYFAICHQSMWCSTAIWCWIFASNGMSNKKENNLIIRLQSEQQLELDRSSKISCQRMWLYLCKFYLTSALWMSMCHLQY